MRPDAASTSPSGHSFVFSFRLLMVIAFVLAGLQTAAAIGVSTRNFKLNAGVSDFGSGTHSFGGPSGNAVVTFDYDQGTGQVIATGRVQGTVYWDSLISGGCARVTILFRDSDSATLATRRVTVCGSGGNANDSDNKAGVDESFSSRELHHIVVTVNEFRDGQLFGGASSTSFAPLIRTYLVLLEGGESDFGEIPHFAETPTRHGLVWFERTSGLMTGSVDGVLFIDSQRLARCAKLLMEFSDLSRNPLSNVGREKCGPGRNANDGANQLRISESFRSGSLSSINLRVGTVSGPFFVNETSRLSSFYGIVGTADVEPAEAETRVGEALDYAFSWTVPAPLNWHDLSSMQLRISDGSEVIFWIRFDEATNSFSRYNERSGRFGEYFAAGSSVSLQSRYAMLHLDGASVSPINGVLGDGPVSPSVSLNLPFTFKPSARGRTFTVEVAAEDDLGNEDPFAVAGTLAVK